MDQKDLDISTLLGKEITSPDCEAVLSKLDKATRVKPQRDASQLRWISKQAGVEVRADAGSKRIVDMFLYAGGDGFKRYSGGLPYGIRFEFKSPAVKACFPSAPVGSDSEADCWDEEDRRIIVTYDDDGNITDVYLTTAF